MVGRELCVRCKRRVLRSVTSGCGKVCCGKRYGRRIASRTDTTDSAQAKPVATNVLDRRFDGWAINRAWLADVTYIPTDEGWLYLACVLDLGSRKTSAGR